MDLRAELRQRIVNTTRSLWFELHNAGHVDLPPSPDDIAVEDTDEGVTVKFFSGKPETTKGKSKGKSSKPTEVEDTVA